jgi:hypothetical protein
MLPFKSKSSREKADIKVAQVLRLPLGVNPVSATRNTLITGELQRHTFRDPEHFGHY